MNFGKLAETTTDLQQSQQVSWSELGLSAGVDKGAWNEIVNLRLEVDGEYVFWKSRGGTRSVRSVAGNVLNAYPFTSRVNGILAQYIAMQTSMGNIELWNVDTGVSSVVMSGFPTAEKIQIVHRGIFLYAFTYDGGTAKYHDLEGGGSYNFLDYKQSYIEDADFISGSIEEQNLFGFAKSNQVLVYPNTYPSGGTEIDTPASGDGVLDYTQYPVNSFRYTYSGGTYIVDENGKEYKQSQFISFAAGDPPLKYSVAGSGSGFTIEEFFLPLDEKGNVSWDSYVATIEEVDNFSETENFITWRNNIGLTSSANLGNPVQEDPTERRNIAFPYSDDLKNMVGLPGLYQVGTGVDIDINDNYVPPSIYRNYIIVDLLNDGSVCVAGKPYQLEASQTDLYQDGALKVRFTVSEPSANVVKRYLCSTRWQTTPQRAFEPSQPDYPNSPLFIVKEVDRNRLFIQDDTPDSQLQRPLNEILSMSGGVVDLFGTGQLKINSIAKFKGSLLAAGYTVSRPIPKPYTNPANAIEENIFLNISPTTQLPNDMALAFQFEYSDGQRSNIVETEQFLQEGSTVESQPVSCDQTKGFVVQALESGAANDGELQLTYEGVSVSIPLTVANHSAAADAAEAIRQAVANSADIRIDADVISTAEIKYTEKRYGDEHNGNIIDIEPVPISATAFIDVTSNTLAGSGSENHTITIDGSSTAAITINDTDTIEQIVDKYVSEINGDATISPNFTASKEDNGDGSWRCLITVDAAGAAGNGKSVAVSGNTDVSLTVDSPTSGGSDSPNITFDTQDPVIANAEEPAETNAMGFFATVGNNQSAGETDEWYAVVDGNQTDNFTINWDDTLRQITASLFDALRLTTAITDDWTVNAPTTYIISGQEYPGLSIVAKNTGAEWNGREISVNPTSKFGVEFRVSSPGNPWTTSSIGTTTSGAGVSCKQALASIKLFEGASGDITVSEDHTITLDGVASNPITIDPSDTDEQIADKYIAGIQNTTDLDLFWEAQKIDLSPTTGSNDWLVEIQYRQYGTIGNGKEVTVTGDSFTRPDSLSIEQPTSGGEDGGVAPTGPAEEVNANRLQVHSLNALVSKVYILGRTTDTGTTFFHLIEEVEITNGKAHGQIIDLPNSEEKLNDIETDTFSTPSPEDVLEQVDLQNYVLIGTPFQQFNIGAQKEIVDQSKILRAFPLDFDVDKTLMRYKIAIFTDENIQFGYLTEGTSQIGQFYEADFEVIYNNVVLENRKGAALVRNVIPFQDREGLNFLRIDGALNKLIDRGRFSVLSEKEIVDTVYYQRENEYWFFCKDNDIVVFDVDSEGFYLARLGDTRSVYSACFGHDTFYVGMNNGLYETDVRSLFVDYPDELEPDTIACLATTSHIASEAAKVILKELLVAGQQYQVGVDIDLQQGRRETGGAIWTKSFTADKSFAAKACKMYGENYQLNAHGPMPRIRLSFDSVQNGLISSIRLKSQGTANTGKARE